MENKYRGISEFEIISEEEKNRILFDFNNTGAEYPNDKTIHELFKEQVVRTPDHIAVIGAHELNELYEISYRELNEKSNRLAQVIH